MGIIEVFIRFPRNALLNILIIVITGAIQGTSPERLYRELGLESLTDRRWIRKLVFFYKIKNGLSP